MALTSKYYLQHARGGGGGTDSLSLGTNEKLQPPFFVKKKKKKKKGQPLVLPSPNLQPPIVIDTQEQPLKISIKWGICCIIYIIFYQIIVLKGFKNKFECIHFLF